MTFITNAPTRERISLPDIERGQKWRDEVLDITYRTLHNRPDGWSVRCIGESGNVWYDVMPHICFATELTLVN